MGGKVLNLAEVKRAGLPVPDGFCVTTSAYEDFVAAQGLGPAIRSVLSSPDQSVAAAERLRDGIRGGRMAAEVRAAVLTAYRQLAAGRGLACPVAVRSSALAEDLLTASFAGQQATLLNVRNEEQLLQAILECWASLWSAQAVLYRARQGVSEVPAMAVLVQEMVSAESAGVAFSRDPVSGEERVVIEVAWGQGEAVVSGSGVVDRYTVRRDTGQEVGPPVVGHKKSMRAMAGGGGLETVDVPAHKQTARVLTTEQVRQIGTAVLGLEGHFGCPQDMEWAWAGGQLYVLQARPITRREDSFFTTLVAQDDELWTAGFLNERFPSPVSPLGWTVVNKVLERFAFRDPLRYLGLRDADGLRITRLYRGHPYVNLFVFQTLYRVFPDWLLPEDAYRYFPSGKTELRRAVSYPRSLFDPRFLCSMVWHFLQQPALWSPWHNDRVWAAFVVEHERRSQSLEGEYEVLRATDSTVEPIWATIRRAQELNAELLAIHRWSLTCADLTYSLLRRLLRVWVKQEDAMALCTRLLAGLPNRSVEMDRALHLLARQDEGTAGFADALGAFLQQYGHRSFSLDIYHPSFADEPAQVLALVRQVRSEGSAPGDERVAMREEASRALQHAVGRGAWGWLKRGTLNHVLHLARRYLPLREGQRFYWQKTLALMRRLFLYLGERMVRAGALQEAGQVFFLTEAEVEAYVQGQAGGNDAHRSETECSYAQLAVSRQRQFARLCRDSEIAPERAYPPFLRGNEPLPEKGEESAEQFQGHGVSPGLAQGRVVIVRSPAELSKIQRGDVLVAAGVDPGWTPVFGLLSALVLEHGGQLSHAAVVAREYGLPAVAGVQGISASLHDGDVVLVDGLNGWVSRIG